MQWLTRWRYTYDTNNYTSERVLRSFFKFLFLHNIVLIRYGCAITNTLNIYIWFLSSLFCMLTNFECIHTILYRRDTRVSQIDSSISSSVSRLLEKDRYWRTSKSGFLIKSPLKCYSKTLVRPFLVIPLESQNELLKCW